MITGGTEESKSMATLVYWDNDDDDNKIDA